jgi:predicted GH43/DUF377 family glycosyl hydrolase
MWYTGYDGSAHRIGYATSIDGIIWMKHLSNPVIGLGSPGSWNDTNVYFPSVLFDGLTYHMWFTGRNASAPADRIGYATSPDGVIWTEGAPNPVFDVGLVGSWEGSDVRTPVVVFEGGTYHMWYSGYNGTKWRIGYANSSDGIIWLRSVLNPVMTFGPSGSWDSAHVFYPAVIYDGNVFQMWYSGADGSNTRIGYTTSTDGSVWYRHKSNPVLDIGIPGSWDNFVVWFPSILLINSVYCMWYGGKDGTTYRIGYATSPDGITWTKKPSAPVVNVGSGGSWEEWYVNGPSVIFDGITYHLWYTGSNGVNQRIGYATSTDGISWTKSPSNPVLDTGPSPWDSVQIGAPSVIYDGIMYHMWYSGSDGTNWRIGYATSPNGISWTKSGSNPVMILGSTGDWDDEYVLDPTVIFDGIRFHMWYAGYDGTISRIGYATSLDGVSWQLYSGNLCPGTFGDGCVLDAGPPGSWDSIYAEDPTVVYDGKTYLMWYAGVESGGPETRIGYATSTDRINWTKHSGNPVLDLGPSGYWDDLFVYEPAVIIDGSTFKMWFAAHDGTNTRISYAIMQHWRTGNLTSYVFDSGADSTTWNSISWTESLPQGTNITVATRGGKTSTPDASWSPWSAEVWDETGSVIGSPANRYFQYRVRL